MEEIISFFGGKTSLANKLGVDAAAVSYWLREGLPPARAIQIEALSDGRFKATNIVGAKSNAA